VLTTPLVLRQSDALDSERLGVLPSGTTVRVAEAKMQADGSMRIAILDDSSRPPSTRGWVTAAKADGRGFLRDGEVELGAHIQTHVERYRDAYWKRCTKILEESQSENPLGAKSADSKAVAELKKKRDEERAKELELRRDIAAKRSAVVDRLNSLDADGDGTITVDEAGEAFGATPTCVTATGAGEATEVAVAAPATEAAAPITVAPVAAPAVTPAPAALPASAPAPAAATSLSKPALPEASPSPPSDSAATSSLRELALAPTPSPAPASVPMPEAPPAAAPTAEAMVTAGPVPSPPSEAAPDSSVHDAPAALPEIA
jgi:hypothetical protein